MRLNNLKSFEVLGIALFFVGVSAVTLLLRQSRKQVSKFENTGTVDYAIIANGPFLPRELISEIIAGKVVIALDGAANKLAKIGIIPHVILGDFDSISDQNGCEIWGIKDTFDQIDETSDSYGGNFQVKIIPAKNQDLTDLVKAIRYCDLHNARMIEITCATDGRLDHTLGNLRTLRSEYKPNRLIRIHTSTETISFLSNTSLDIKGMPGDYCGIMAFPKAYFNSTGLQYNGNNYPLEFGFSESVCNRLSDSEAHVEVRGEALLIAPGLFPVYEKFKKIPQDEIGVLVYEEQSSHLLLSSSDGFNCFNRVIKAIKIKATQLYDSEELSEKLDVINESDVKYALSDDEKDLLLLSLSSRAYNKFSFFSKFDAEEISKCDKKELETLCN